MSFISWNVDFLGLSHKFEMSLWVEREKISCEMLRDENGCDRLLIESRRQAEMTGDLGVDAGSLRRRTDSPGMSWSKAARRLRGRRNEFRCPGQKLSRKRERRKEEEGFDTKKNKSGELRADLHNYTPNWNLYPHLSLDPVQTITF